MDEEKDDAPPLLPFEQVTALAAAAPSASFSSSRRWLPENDTVSALAAAASACAAAAVGGAQSHEDQATGAGGRLRGDGRWRQGHTAQRIVAGIDLDDGGVARAPRRVSTGRGGGAEPLLRHAS
eukprot:SAG31_NODE_27529_length_424_cov_1.301538_1_plen_123_part_10